MVDIFCGNAALTSLLETKVNIIIGHDPSSFRIYVVNSDFSSNKLKFNLSFQEEEISFIDKSNKNINKILFNRSFSCSKFTEFLNVFKKLYSFLPIDARVFIDNISNIKFRTDSFTSFTNSQVPPARSHYSSIGVWYSPLELKSVSPPIGMQALITFMLPFFYFSNSRFDYTLIEK